ncbi:MAG: hypothetical protein IIA89_07715 [Chloroflexi bacterium]|nr:hypothetical protein [Chloroflexota bacterium]
MSDPVDSVERIIGRLYTAFILRDLTFVFAGGMVLSVASRHPIETLIELFSLPAEQWWIGLVIFLLAAYVLGMVLQESVRWFLRPASKRYIQWRLGKSISNGQMVVRLDRIIRADCSEHTMLAIERTQFIKQTGSTQLAALLSIAILVALKVHGYAFSGLLLLALPIGMILTSWIYLDKSLEQEKILSGLEKNIGNSRTSPQ